LEPQAQNGLSLAGNDARAQAPFPGHGSWPALSLPHRKPSQTIAGLRRFPILLRFTRSPHPLQVSLLRNPLAQSVQPASLQEAHLADLPRADLINLPALSFDHAYQSMCRTQFLPARLFVPRQLANRTQAPLQATCAFGPRASCGISCSFPQLSPTQG